MMRNRYAKIPAAAVFDNRIRHAELHLLCALGAHANSEGRCWPSTITLANLLGVSDRSIRKHLRKLEAAGYVKTEHRPGQRSVYRIDFDAPDPGTSDSGVKEATPEPQIPGLEADPGTSDSAPPEPHLPGTPESQVPPNNRKNIDKEQKSPPTYAFQGTIVRLKPEKFVEWQETYHAIPDLKAVLVSEDEFYASKDTKGGKDWYWRIQRKLNALHQDRLAAQKAKAPSSDVENAGLPPELPESIRKRREADLEAKLAK